MNNSKTLLSVILVVTSLFISINTHADNDTDNQIVVFGDSLSDNGNLEAIVNLQGRQYPPETFGGRASDGLLGVEVLAQLMGYSLEPSLFALGLNQGNNYSVATARARSIDGLPIHLSSQVGAYLINNNGVSDPNKVYVFQIGSNDVRDAFFAEDSHESIIHDAIASLQSNLAAIINSGAQKIMVTNAPTLIDLPEIRDVISGLSYHEKMRQKFKARLLSYHFNKKLSHVIKSAQYNHPSVKIVGFSFPKFIRTVKKNADAFGFDNTKNGCLLLDIDNLQYSSTACDLDTDIHSYLFFDQIHLSGAGHDYLGRSLYAQLPR